MKAVMKALMILASLAVSLNAFAFTPDQASKSLSDPAVQAAMEGKILRSVTDAPSYRCVGCFGLKLVAVTEQGEEITYELQGQDFGDAFRVTIAKMDGGSKAH